MGAAYGNRSGPLIPYGGGQGGFIPYGGLESRRAAEPVMTPREIPQTMIGGASNIRTPIGGASRMQGPDIYQPLNYRGRFGKGGSSGLPPRYGPGFGSPFRRPPLLLGGGM